MVFPLGVQLHLALISYLGHRQDIYPSLLLPQFMSVTYNIIIFPALSVPLPYSFLLPSFPSLLPIPVSNVHRWRPGRIFNCFLEARSKFNTLVALRFILSCLWQSPVPNLSFICFDSISLEVTSLPVWHLYVPEVATGFIQLLFNNCLCSYLGT